MLPLPIILPPSPPQCHRWGSAQQGCSHTALSSTPFYMAPPLFLKNNVNKYFGECV